MMFYFSGYQCVEQCCGAVLDEMYRIGGEGFATAYIREYAQNPGDRRFKLFQNALYTALRDAKTNAERTAQTTEEMNRFSPII